MADITAEEIKGISARNLITLLSCVIFVEFTVLMSYNSITTTAKENRDRITIIEAKVSKLEDKVNTLETQISIIDSKNK